MRSFFLALILTVSVTAFCQTPTNAEMAAAGKRFIGVLGSRQFGRLADMVGTEGVVVYYCFPDHSKRWASQKAFRLALGAKTSITWLPAMQGDGGMRDAVKMSLKDLIGIVASSGWGKAKASYNTSKQMIYRTLFVEDLKPEHKGSGFVDYTILSQGEFQGALILGFARQKGSKSLKLTAIGFDQFKD